MTTEIPHPVDIAASPETGPHPVGMAGAPQPLDIALAAKPVDPASLAVRVAMAKDPPPTAPAPPPSAAAALELSHSSDMVVGLPDWAPAHTVYVGWPIRKDVWREGARPARAAIAVLVRAIANFAKVCVLSSRDGGSYAEAVQEFKADRSAIRVECVEMDDCWLRDTGPIFARGSSWPTAPGKSNQANAEEDQVVAVSFEFNAWGGDSNGCYGNYERDRKVAPKIAAIGGVPCEFSDVVLEGGSVTCDGQGTVITTEECLLHGNRNPGVTADIMELCLRDTLGARRVIWLPYGVRGDSDTNGHVDNMCVFVAPATVILHWADADVDPDQHARSRAAFRRLNAAVDANGRRFKVYKVSAPSSPVMRTDAEASGIVPIDNAGWAKPRLPGELLAASYINVLFVDKAVIIPAFGVIPDDDLRAEAQIQEAVGMSRKVIPVPAREFVLAGGGLHCLTVAQPQCARIRT